MAFSRYQRLGGLALVCALTVGVAAAAVVTAQGSGDRPASAQTGPAEGSATDSAPSPSETPSPTPSPEAPRPSPAEQAAPVPADPAVQKQLAYVLAHWQDYNDAQYGVVTGNDCVNFTSQSLIERGWKMDDQWHTSGTGANFRYSSPWVSSTAFMRYLAASGRATPLTDDQRDQVKVGDIAQFDWDNSGDRDHTGVVTRVEGSGKDRVIYYGGHTEDSDYRSVDWAITVRHPGGSVYYWSIP